MNHCVVNRSLSVCLRLTTEATGTSHHWGEGGEREEGIGVSLPSFLLVREGVVCGVVLEGHRVTFEK